MYYKKSNFKVVYGKYRQLPCFSIKCINIIGKSSRHKSQNVYIFESNLNYIERKQSRNIKSFKFTYVRDMTYNELICRREACRDEIAETKEKLRGCGACQKGFSLRERSFTKKLINCRMRYDT